MSFDQFLHYVLPIIAAALFLLALSRKPGGMLHGMGIGIAIGMMIMVFQHTTFWTAVISIVCFGVSCAFVHMFCDEFSDSLARGERNHQ